MWMGKISWRIEASHVPRICCLGLKQAEATKVSRGFIVLLLPNGDLPGTSRWTEGFQRENYCVTSLVYLKRTHRSNWGQLLKICMYSFYVINVCASTVQFDFFP